VATKSGWKFKAGQVHEHHADIWVGISKGNDKVKDQLNNGWCPKQFCNLAPTWFQSNQLSDQEQEAWDAEVCSLWAMKAIEPIDWNWVSRWGLPRVILPVFMVDEVTKFRPIMDARYSNLSLQAEWFSCPKILNFCHLHSKD